MKKAEFIFFNCMQGISRHFGLILLFLLPVLIYGCLVSRPATERSQAFFICPVPGAYTEDVTMEGAVKSTMADTIFMVYLGWNKKNAPVIDTVWVNGTTYRAIIRKVPDGHHFIGRRRSTGDSIFITTSNGVAQYFRLDLVPTGGKANWSKSGIVIKGLNRGRLFEMYMKQMTELSPGIRM